MLRICISRHQQSEALTAQIQHTAILCTCSQTLNPQARLETACRPANSWLEKQIYKDTAHRSNFTFPTMPSTELALSIQHYPRHHPHLSRLETTRRTSTSLSSYRRALELASLSLCPTPSQLTMLYLPLNDEHLSHFAWQTSLLQGNHTNALIPIPRGFALLAVADGRSSPPQQSQLSYLVARRTSGAASVTARIRFSGCCFDVAELEWIGGTALETNNLRYAETAIDFPFYDPSLPSQTQSQSQLTRLWPGPFSDWIDRTLCEFAAESNRSAWRYACYKRVWEEAERKARESVAICVMDGEVGVMLLGLSGCEAVGSREDRG
jgi:hypothetical protein